jgi:hypothetical protein
MKLGWVEMQENLRTQFQDPAKLRAYSRTWFVLAGLVFAWVVIKIIFRMPESPEDYTRVVSVFGFLAFGAWCRIQATSCERIIALEKGLKELKESQAVRPEAFSGG